MAHSRCSGFAGQARVYTGGCCTSHSSSGVCSSRASVNACDGAPGGLVIHHAQVFDQHRTARRVRLQHHLDHGVAAESAIQIIQLLARGGAHGDGGRQIIAAAAFAHHQIDFFKIRGVDAGDFSTVRVNSGCAAPMILIGKRQEIPATEGIGVLGHGEPRRQIRHTWRCSCSNREDAPNRKNFNIEREMLCWESAGPSRASTLPRQAGTVPGNTRPANSHWKPWSATPHSGIGTFSQQHHIGG